jgi:hypothetical protein
MANIIGHSKLVDCIYEDSITACIDDAGQTYYLIYKLKMDTPDATELAAGLNYIKYKGDIRNIRYEKTDCYPIKSLYWITGGDKIWANIDWYNYADLLSNELGEIIVHIWETSDTIGELQDRLSKTLNPARIFELLLKLGIKI